MTVTTLFLLIISVSNIPKLHLERRIGRAPIRYRFPLASSVAASKSTSRRSSSPWIRQDRVLAVRTFLLPVAVFARWFATLEEATMLPLPPVRERLRRRGKSSFSLDLLLFLSLHKAHSPFCKHTLFISPSVTRFYYLLSTILLHHFHITLSIALSIFSPVCYLIVNIINKSAIIFHHF